MIIGAALRSFFGHDLVMGLGAMCFAAPNPRALSFGISKRGRWWWWGRGWNYGIWIQLINLLRVQRFFRTPHLPSRWYRRE